MVSQNSLTPNPSPKERELEDKSEDYGLLKSK